MNPCDVSTKASLITWAYDIASNLSPGQLVALKSEIEAALARMDCCEHGIQCGDWCPECLKEYHRAAFKNGDL